MLGLGTPITRSEFISADDAPLYSKEVIESGDGWSINGDGSPTIQYNQTAPNGVAGWMKITFDQDQSDWNLQNSSILSGNVSSGQTATISYDLYLHNAALWGDDTSDDDDVVSWRTDLFASSSPVGVPTDTSTRINWSKTKVIPYDVIYITVFKTGSQPGGLDVDLPLAGASFYMKNLEVTVS